MEKIDLSKNIQGQNPIANRRRGNRGGTKHCNERDSNSQL